MQAARMSSRVLTRDMSVIGSRTLNFIKLLISIIPTFNSLWQSKASDYRITLNVSLMSFYDVVAWNMVFCGWYVMIANTRNWSPLVASVADFVQVMDPAEWSKVPHY